MKIYVGNLDYEVKEDELMKQFAAYGEVTSVSLPTDQYSGRPRGFGFVEMADKSQAQAAISGLNGKMLKSRTLVVNEARPSTGGQRGGYGDRSGGMGNRGGGRMGGGRMGGRRY